jgi:hypothetical protein
VTIARANLPNDTLAVTVSITDPGHSHLYGSAIQGGPTGGGNLINPGAFNTTSSSTTGITASGTAALNGGVTQTAVNKMPPTIIVNYILRIF